MSDQLCVSCQRPKAKLTCGVCEEAVCKECVQTLDPDSFAFFAKKPESLSHSFYCGSCFDSTVAAELEKYESTMELAKEVEIFFESTQIRHIPLVSRSKLVHQVKDCSDRDEVILRLAFFAAEHGYNAMIEVKLVSEKIQNKSRSYQQLKWSATGLAAQIDEAKLARMDLMNKKD